LLYILTRLAVGTAGPLQWFVLGVPGAVIIILGYVTQKYADRGDSFTTRNKGDVLDMIIIEPKMGLKKR